MSSRCNKSARTVRIASLIAGAVLLHRAASAEVLNVCIDQANPTSGMDARVARAAIETQGNAVKVIPFVGYGKGGDGLPPNRFAKMAQSDCQLIMGFPVDISNPNLPPDVKATSAYAGTGFVLVRRAGAEKTSLSEIPKGSEVGIAQLDTYAGLLYGEHPNIVMHVYPTDSLMLADLAAKHISAGLAWEPFIASYEQRRAKPLSVDLLPGKHMRWNLVALYAPPSQRVADLFAKGLYELQSKGKLERLIKPYQQPTAIAAVRPAAQLAAAHLQYAVAWDSEPGRLTQVADAGTAPQRKHGKVPALYTEDQAAKGALAYYQNCAVCHGPLLDGQPGGYSGPALKGADFADPSYDFHLSDIFNFVAKLMPAATPGSLTHEQYVQIMAFILKQNGYPAGSHELVYEQAEKSKVPIRYYGK